MQELSLEKPFTEFFPLEFLAQNFYLLPDKESNHHLPTLKSQPVTAFCIISRNKIGNHK